MKKNLYREWMIRLQMFLAAEQAAPAPGQRASESPARLTNLGVDAPAPSG